jgi:hypothetical protein
MELHHLSRLHELATALPALVSTAIATERPWSELQLQLDNLNAAGINLREDDVEECAELERTFDAACAAVREHVQVMHDTVNPWTLPESQTGSEPGDTPDPVQPYAPPDAPDIAQLPSGDMVLRDLQAACTARGLTLRLDHGWHHRDRIALLEAVNAAHQVAYSSVWLTGSQRKASLDPKVMRRGSARYRAFAELLQKVTA